jgi:hypothetical protein
MNMRSMGSMYTVRVQIYVEQKKRGNIPIASIAGEMSYFAAILLYS